MKYLLTICCCFFMLACSENKDEANAALNPIEQAFGTNQSNIDTADLQKLATATGVEADDISIEILEGLIESATEGLTLFCFWKLDSPQSVEQMLELRKLKQSNLVVVLINLDNLESNDAINILLRKKGIPFSTFKLIDYDRAWFEEQLEGWSGKLPALYLVNQTQGVKQLYTSFMEADALNAILAPLDIK